MTRAVIVKADAAGFAGIRRTRNPGLDRGLSALSRAADHGLLWLGAAAVLAVSGDRDNRRAALRGMTGLAAASVLANGPAKLLARRPRPPLLGTRLLHEATRLHGAGFRRGAVLLRVAAMHGRPATFSFPSGHAASAAAFALGVGLERPRLGAALGVVAGGVALSRVHAGVHYSSGVLAGLTLGAGASAALTRVWPVHRPVPARHRAPDAKAPALPDGDGLHLVVNLDPDDGAQLSDQVRQRLPAAKVHVLGDGEDLPAVLARATVGTAVLGIAGGDGSINAAARAALDADLPLLVLPAGTLNHFAGELGVDNLDGALDALAAGAAALVDVACADLPGGGREIFLNNASIGGYPEMVAAREQLEGRLGKWLAMFVALARILRHTDPVEVDLDGARHRLWLLFAGNCVYSPPGFAPSWRDHLDDGLLDLRLIDATHPYARTRLVLAVLTGRLARSPIFQTRTAAQVRVRTLDGDGMRLARDGEVGEPVAGFTLTKTENLRVYRP